MFAKSPDNRTTQRCTPLRVEHLEERWVPTTLDLTFRGSIGAVNGAIFRQVEPQPTGTGVIDSFVRIQPQGQAAIGQGYNTAARPLQFDENSSPQFTRALPLGSIPKVNIGGVMCREFLLDINQKASSPLLSLDELRLFVGGAGNLRGYDAASKQLAGLSAVFDLDSGGDNWIKLNARLSHGSGSGDALVYIPSHLFGPEAASSFVYLYSKFGVNEGANGGFEEWAVAASRSSPFTAACGSISGTVFQRTTSGDIPFAGATVYLDANHNSVLDAGEDFTTTSNGTSGPVGSYAFTGLATGLGAFSTYDVKDLPSSLPPGSITLPPANYLVLLSAPCQKETGKDFFFELRPVQEPGSISGRVGLPGSGPVHGEGPRRPFIPRAGVTVFIDADLDGTLDSNELSTLTGVDGRYSFTSLPTGPGTTYRITLLFGTNPFWDVLLETSGATNNAVNFVA